MGTSGGYGIAAYGRSQFGHAASEYEARFAASQPVDASTNNPNDVWIRFTTYCYSGWVDVQDVLIEISENGGSSYSLAFDGTSFLAPYDGLASKHFRPDGQTLVFMIGKTDVWPLGATVRIRFTGPDEFGQPASKNIPVLWPDP